MADEKQHGACHRCHNDNAATGWSNLYLYLVYSKGSRNPATGNFLSQEPTGIDGPNLVWAFGNNPVKNVDPSGLEYSSRSESASSINTDEGVQLVVDSYMSESDGIFTPWDRASQDREQGNTAGSDTAAAAEHYLYAKGDVDGFGDLRTRTSKIDGSTQNFAYGADGKLNAFQSGNLLENIFYDGLGRQVARLINDGTNTYTITKLYLGDTNTLLQAKAGDGSITTYIDGQGINEHLGEIKNGVGKIYVTDHLGSVLNGEAAGSAHAFGLFGEPSTTLTITPTSSAVMYGFQGMQYDSESGNYSAGPRTYNPNISRWNQQDPIGFASGDANYYRAMGNNLQRYVDPMGRAAEEPLGGGGYTDTQGKIGYYEEMATLKPKTGDFYEDSRLYALDARYGISDNSIGSADDSREAANAEHYLWARAKSNIFPPLTSPAVACMVPGYQIDKWQAQYTKTPLVANPDATEPGLDQLMWGWKGVIDGSLP